MACDIHLHIELKINDEWEHYAHPDITRWYELFGKMAGVRDESIEPISEPKGLPDNLSVITKINYDYWECDAHSMSWFNADEIGLLADWLTEKDIKAEGFSLDNYLEDSILHTYLFGNSFAGLNKWKEDYKIPGLQDVRFIFWFDN